MYWLKLTYWSKTTADCLLLVVMDPRLRGDTVRKIWSGPIICVKLQEVGSHPVHNCNKSVVQRIQNTLIFKANWNIQLGCYNITIEGPQGEVVDIMSLSGIFINTVLFSKSFSVSIYPKQETTWKTLLLQALSKYAEICVWQFRQLDQRWKAPHLSQDFTWGNSASKRVCAGKRKRSLPFFISISYHNCSDTELA